MVVAPEADHPSPLPQAQTAVSVSLFSPVVQAFPYVLLLSKSRTDAFKMWSVKEFESIIF